MIEKNKKMKTNLNKFSKIAVLTDKNIASLWLDKVKKNIDRKIIPIIIDPGEKSKTLKTSEKIWKKMLESKMNRHSLLINLGGGVICDLGGFVASTYMRGIGFINIPTTLLAMVDASVGGKTGVNLDGIKNIIGTFADPLEVVIDISFLKTLPKRIFIEGFSEIIKHGIIADGDYFAFVSSKKPEEFNNQEIEKIIKRSIEIKSAIVSQDKKEKGLRKILNFGHTIGHAIESENIGNLLHGEAVALGMIAESRLANLIGLLPLKDFQKIKTAIKNAGLLVKIDNFDKKTVLKKMLKDKKNNKGKILFSLPDKIGSAKFNVEVDEKLIIQSTKEILT